MTFKKLATITTLTCTSLFAANAFALNDYQMSCDTSITSDISFANNELALKSTKQENILFKANGMVFVDGKEITLTKDEQKLAKTYHNDVEASIPMVVDITVEALEITNMSLSAVFTGLLGEDSKLPQKLNNRINEIANSMKAHVYQDPNSLTFNSTYLQNDLGIGNELDQEIEEMKDEIVSSVMGQLVVAIGKAMISGDGDFSELQNRMETLGQDIEKKAEALAQGLKEKSIGLCDKIKKLDETENQLRKIEELRYLNTIHYNKLT